MKAHPSSSNKSEYKQIEITVTSYEADRIGNKTQEYKIYRSTYTNTRTELKQAQFKYVMTIKFENNVSDLFVAQEKVQRLSHELAQFYELLCSEKLYKQTWQMFEYSGLLISLAKVIHEEISFFV